MEYAGAGAFPLMTPWARRWAGAAAIEKRRRPGGRLALQEEKGRRERLRGGRGASGGARGVENRPRWGWGKSSGLRVGGARRALVEERQAVTPEIPGVDTVDTVDTVDGRLGAR